jgi:hypothetical protein
MGMPGIARSAGSGFPRLPSPAAPHHRPPFRAYQHENVRIVAVGAIPPHRKAVLHRRPRLVEAWAEITAGRPGETTANDQKRPSVRVPPGLKSPVPRRQLPRACCCHH